ncbi:MAG: InlB B-repeat-containing protein [Ruminococcus flavefaciens]|nr:InlB B-repeat-containing protein [Ruminococcus flavefaciens]
MKRIGKIFVFMIIMFILCAGRAKAVQAYTFNVSTNQVSSYLGCEATGCGYSGKTTYINIWDSSISNTMKSITITVYKNDVYDISDSYTAADSMNYISFGFTFYSTGEYTYKITGTSIDGTTFDGSGSFRIYDQEPVIAAHPSAATVMKDQDVTFSISVSQGTHVSYQWWYNTTNDTSKGHAISGATSSSYTFTADASMDGRYYFCVLSNDGNTKISDAAKLTVQYAPDITINSSEVYAYNGDSASFSVSVSGGNPNTYSYQWYYAASPTGAKTLINGAASSKYSVTASSALHGRYYYCQVRNGNIYTYSSGSRLYVRYVVKYDANGGSGAPGNQHKNHGEDLSLSSQKPSRSGYTFLGWAASKMASTASYLPGGTYTENADLTLYAVWKEGKDLSSTPVPAVTNTRTPQPATMPTPGTVLTPVPASTSTPAASFSPSFKEVWTEKGIHAYVCYQTSTWDHRDGEKDSYYYLQANGMDVSTTAKVVDVNLIKDGIYTVSISGIDLSGATKFYMLGIATDINKEIYPDVQVTNMKVSIDGKVVTQESDDIPISKKDDKNNNFMVINEWDADRDTNGGSVHYPLGKVNADEGLVMPADGIEITFAISGLSKVLQDIKNGNYIDPETGNKIQNNNVYPSETVTPGETVNPNKTVSPSATVTPNVTVSPDTTAFPDETEVPNKTAYPSETSYPGEVTDPYYDIPYPGVTNSSKLSQTITARSFTMYKGTWKNINARTSGDGILQYQSSNPAVVHVSSSGRVWAAGPGKAEITISAPETSRYYKAVRKITVNVKLKGTAIKKLSSKKKGKMIIAWKKVKGISGYQIHVARNKKFNSAGHGKGKIVSAKKTKVSASRLSSGKIYYVRIRTYQKVNGKKYYSAWSKVKKIKIR